MDVRADRKRRGIVATFKSVDTCAAEFEAYTPYYYSTYEDEDETPAKQPGQRRVMILGGGPNRIGQGIEFDYCCCHASFALRELGIQSIMVNSNPETVSTDYDTSDLLFFEPLTTEDVLNICDRVQPDGVIVQFGGQTPLNLARALSNAGVPIIGTSVDTIEDAEDREKFPNVLRPAGAEAAGQRHRPHHGPGPRRGGQGRLSRCWCGRVSCWGAGRWKSATTPPSSSDSWPRPSSSPRGSRCSSTASWKTPPRWTSTPSPTASSDRGRHHGAHRGGGRPLGRFGLRHPALQPARPRGGRNPRGHLRHGPATAASRD